MRENPIFMIMGISALIFALAAFLLGRFSKKRMVKYIPALAAALFSGATLIKARFFSEGFQDLAYVILSMIGLAAFVAALFVALIMEWAYKGE